VQERTSTSLRAEIASNAQLCLNQQRFELAEETKRSNAAVEPALCWIVRQKVGPHEIGASGMKTKMQKDHWIVHKQVGHHEISSKNI